MVKDRVFKLIGIPLLGLIIPICSHFFLFAGLSFFELFLSFSYFSFSAFLIWKAMIWIVSFVRNSQLKSNIGLKLLALVSATSVSAFLVSAAAIFLAQKLNNNTTYPTPIYQASLICAGVVSLIALVYEILFLHKERQIDSQIVRHLDRELMEAEINVLRNELDPHFVYNSLMPLYYLVKNDIQKAEAFACKLIQVYQYFLENRQSDYVTLKEELTFIENYFFLLQIRFKDSMTLSIQIPNGADKMLVLPSSLQMLIENAIKHNEIDKGDPLHISVSIERNCLVVSNNLRSKSYEMASSKIGLKNLRARYKVITGSDISVIKNKELFIVKIPLLRTAKAYDVNSYNRG